MKRTVSCFRDIETPESLILAVDITLLLSTLRCHQIEDVEKLVALILREYHGLVLPLQWDLPSDQLLSLFTSLEQTLLPFKSFPITFPFTIIDKMLISGTTLFLKGEVS